MNETRDPEDILIRRLLIGASVGAVASLLLLALGITILVSSKFNILNWME